MDNSKYRIVKKSNVEKALKVRNHSARFVDMDEEPSTFVSLEAVETVFRDFVRIDRNAVEVIEV